MDNTVSDSDPSWKERGDKGLINPIEEVKRPGANLATPEKAKIARDQKENPVQSGRENRNKTNFKCK